MRKISIYNFGPVCEASVDLEKRMQVYIGAQASGKSTICKVIYFCQKIRDYTLDFLMDTEQFTENHKNEYFNNYMKYLTRQFMGCFGKTKHMQKFRIVYQLKKKQIVIKLNRDGYMRFEFDESLKCEIVSLINNASDMFLRGLNSDKFSSIIDNITALAVMKQQLRGALNHL